MLDKDGSAIALDDLAVAVPERACLMDVAVAAGAAAAAVAGEVDEDIVDGKSKERKDRRVGWWGTSCRKDRSYMCPSPRLLMFPVIHSGNKELIGSDFLCHSWEFSHMTHMDSDSISTSRS